MLRYLLRPVVSGVRRFADRLRDRRLGIETASPVTLGELGIRADDRVDYEPSSWHTLGRVLGRRDVGKDDVFVDFGCGKGRVVIQAARCPFKRVIGVELSPELAAIARENVARVRATLACQDIEIVTRDVLEYDIPDDVTVVYFYNPFEGSIFRAVAEKLVRSVERRPRVLRIVYYSPREESVLLAAGARLVKQARGRRPTPRWSARTSVRLYELSPRSAP